MHRKKIKTKPMLFIVLLSTIILVGGTYAFFNNLEIFKQRFKTPTYNIELKDESNNTWGEKKITIINNAETNAPVVIRINYNETWSKNIDGNLDILNNQVNNTNVVNKEWTNAFLTDFIKGNDGWYYYKKVLQPNQQVQILNSIALNNELISTSPNYEKYTTYDYEIAFNYEAVQATPNAVLKAWNYNININDNDITWDF